MKQLLHLCLVLAAFTHATNSVAEDIIAADQPGASDTEKLHNAIQIAEPGDTIHLGNCTRQAAVVRCHTPRIWTIDGHLLPAGNLFGKNGVEYNGSTETGAKSTLRLVSFTEDDDWDSALWRDILSFHDQPTSSLPTVLRDVIFDGNRNNQGALANPGCEAACGGGQQCVANWCVSPTCDGCSEPSNCPATASCVPEPKQEGLVLSAPSEQRFEVINCEFIDHLWVGLLAWHRSNSEVRGLSTTNNTNAVQLGGHRGVVSLDLVGWESIADRVAFRGEIEGAMRPGYDVVHGRIAKSEIIDPTDGAISFGPKGCNDGIKSTFLVEGVTTRCKDNPDCNAHMHLVPGHATVDVIGNKIGSGDAGGNRDLSIWLQNVGGNVTVRDSELGGYVHFHSVTPGFDPEIDDVLFSNVELSGQPRLAGQYAIPGSPAATYAFYLNGNLNVRGSERLLSLEKIDARAMKADALLHLYGGAARIDQSTLQSHQSLGIAMGGSEGLYTSKVHLQLAPNHWETFEQTQGFYLLTP